MSDYEQQQRRTAKEYAEAVRDLETKKEIREQASRDVDAVQNRVRNLEKDLSAYVGQNRPRKLYQTDHGCVLVAHRFVGSGENPKYKTDVELIPLS